LQVVFLDIEHCGPSGAQRAVQQINAKTVQRLQPAKMCLDCRLNRLQITRSLVQRCQCVGSGVKQRRRQVLLQGLGRVQIACGFQQKAQFLFFREGDRCHGYRWSGHGQYSFIAVQSSHPSDPESE